MAGQQPENSGDEQFQLIIIFAITAFLLFTLIMSQTDQMNALLGAIAWVHVAPIAYLAKVLPFLADIPVLGSILVSPAISVEGFLAKGGYALMDTSPETDGQRGLVLAAAGRCAILYYGPTMLYVAFKGRDFRVDQKYRKTHTLESMIFQQSETWTTSLLARHINPRDQGDVNARDIAATVSDSLAKGSKQPGILLPREVISISPGAWKRSLRPEEWLIIKGLAFNPGRYKDLTSADLMPPSTDFEFRDEWGGIQLESLSEVLAEQLRTPWTGAKNLRPVHKALFAVFALFYDYDLKKGNALLSDLALVYDATGAKSGSMDKAIVAENGLMARIDKIIGSESGSKLSRLGVNHFYVESVFPTFLYFARKERGVLASATFLWLKSEDRLMWYVLNSVGSEAIMVEAAGAIAHSRAEKQIGVPIVRPAVYQASRSILEDYLDMTADRIAVRQRRTDARRIPGDQLGLIQHGILHGDDEKPDPYGLSADD